MSRIGKVGVIFFAMMALAVILAGCQGNHTSSRAMGQETGSNGHKRQENEQSASAGTMAPAAMDTMGEGEGENGKILIAYFAVAENSDVDAASSASMVSVDGEGKGRISYLAELIQEKTRGDLFSIDTSIEYPGNGEKLVDYAAEEQDRDDRPEILNHIENLEEYEIIFVGFPTWWYDLPQVMYSFFDEYDFSGKTIIPFNSHNGSRFSGTIDTIQKLEPEAEVITDWTYVNTLDKKS